MPWQIVILLSLDQAPTFYHLHFQCHETSLSVPLTWSFLPASYPTGYPFRYKHFPHLCQASSPSLSSCGSTSQVSLESEGVNIPRVCGLLVASRESSGVITVCTFICKPVPSFGYFPQCHVGWLLLGDNDCVFCGLSVTWKTDAQWPSPADLERSDEMTCICYLCSDLWTEESGSEVSTLYYIQLIFHKDSYLKSVGENVHYLINM